MPETIIVTGGLGYIGSHVTVELLDKGYKVIILDNLSNSSLSILNNIVSINHEFYNRLKCYMCDIRNLGKLTSIFQKFKDRVYAVIHCAGFKSVGQSVEEPLKYYDNNLNGLMTLLKVMYMYDVKKLVFSSSCTVYGNPSSVPVSEQSPINPINPYGRSVAYQEQILQDLVTSDPDWQIVILRYFNPLGAHKSGLIGERLNNVDKPNNIMPYIEKVAKGELVILPIYGDDYPTNDGTCVRDYIHVMDLSEIHVIALEKLESGVRVFNAGTGKGTSVKELVETFAIVNSIDFPYQIEERRNGDVQEVWADLSNVHKHLEWTPKYTLEDMCRDSWRWCLNTIEKEKENAQTGHKIYNIHNEHGII
jgi:UDP-glucose 4-epimerase